MVLRPVCGVAVLVASLAAQSRTSAPAVDPYTGGDGAAMDRAGVVSYGPFHWGPHDTAAIERAVEGSTFLWLETAHFRIGTTMLAREIASDRAERKAFAKELSLLRKRLPKVNRRTRTLDPWLHLHLFAMRLEDQHADLVRRMGCTDKQLAREGTPHLGMKHKVGVLLFETREELYRYTSTIAGIPSKSPINHVYSDQGMIVFASSVAGRDGLVQAGQILHSHVAYHVANTFLMGFRGWTRESPLWFKLGLCAYYARRADPRFNCFHAALLDTRDAHLFSAWGKRVRARAARDGLASVETMLQWRSEKDLKFIDYLLCWSHVDHLLCKDDDGFRAFVTYVKAEPTKCRTGDPAEILKWNLVGLQGAWDLDADTLAASWRTHVKRRYR